MATDIANVTFLCSGPGSRPLPSKTQIYIANLTAANIVAQKAAVVAWEAAIAPLSSGTVKDSGIVIDTFIGNTYPSGVANRGQKWIVTSANGAGNIFTHTIPAGPGSGELQPDNISALLSGTNWAAYVSAYAAVAQDRAGNGLSILRAVLGGRRA